MRSCEAPPAFSGETRLTVALLWLLVAVGTLRSERVSRPAAAACVCGPGAGSQHPTSCRCLLQTAIFVSFLTLVLVLILLGSRFQPADPSAPVSLVQGKMVTFEPSQRQSGAGVVPWSPPQVNWNPWTSCNIDEGPLAFVSLNAPWFLPQQIVFGETRERAFWV